MKSRISFYLPDNRRAYTKSQCLWKVTTFNRCESHWKNT